MVEERQPTQEEKRRPSWTWQLKETKPTGQLGVEIVALGLKGKRVWTAGDGRTLEEVLGVVVEKTEAVFRGYEQRRIREAEWQRERAEAEKRREEEQAQEIKRRAEEEAKRKEREKSQKHEKKLYEIAQQRLANLVKAAKAWRKAQGVMAFVDVCEARWRSSGAELSKAQTEWLSWARQNAARLEPFDLGYPEPALDGDFDGKSVPFGGPYPNSREWPDQVGGEKQKNQQTTDAPPHPSQQYDPWGYQRGWR